MSKLSGYTEDEQPRIKATFTRLLELKVNKGTVAESETAIKAALPQAFMEACQVVVTLDACMRQLAHYPAANQERIRSVATQLIEGQIASGKVAGTEEAVQAATRVAVDDARQVVTAAEEYLCG
jgi:nicotinamide mononucleotide adenylyltransferase